MSGRNDSCAAQRPIQTSLPFRQHEGEEPIAPLEDEWPAATIPYRDRPAAEGAADPTVGNKTSAAEGGSRTGRARYFNVREEDVWILDGWLEEKNLDYSQFYPSLLNQLWKLVIKDCQDDSRMSETELQFLADMYVVLEGAMKNRVRAFESFQRIWWRGGPLKGAIKDFANEDELTQVQLRARVQLDRKFEQEDPEEAWRTNGNLPRVLPVAKSRARREELLEEQGE